MKKPRYTFKEHEDQFIQPDRVHISVIELGPNQEKEIKTLYRQLRAGKDFAVLAKENSKNSSASKGGDLGFLTRKQYKYLTEVAFTLKPGNVSKPFKSPAGWTIIRVHEIIKKQDIPLEEGVKKAKTRLESVETAKAFDALMKNVRERIGVVLYEDRIKKLQPPTSPKEAPPQKGSWSFKKCFSPRLRGSEGEIHLHSITFSAHQLKNRPFRHPFMFLFICSRWTHTG